MFINEVILNTGKSNELKNFYGKIMELPVSITGENTISIQTINSTLTFTEANDNNYKDAFYHFAFNIPSNKFKEAKEWISERTDLIESEGENEFDFESWNARAMYFYDPAGNILEFIARKNLNNSSNEKFSSKSILSISEIGMPVYDVEKYYTEINTKLNIPLFSGDKKSFAAIGDDNGLMIVVPEKRIWYPNLNEAGIFPVTLIIESGVQKDIQFDELPYGIISES
jgi:catechol-2,3-dioxygenase